MNAKRCFKCSQLKTLSEFYKHSKMRDGHLNKCKLCTKQDVSSNYWKNRDHYIAYEKQRGHIRAGKPARSQPWGEKRCAAQRSRRWLDSEPCEVCGEKQVEAHHEDHAKPLQVNWLCRKHHLAVHGKVAF